MQIFGFDPSSRNSTSSDVNGDHVSTSGQVSISVNYRSRQVGPSNAYVNLCKAQSYSNTEYASGIASNITYFTGVGDARMYGTAPIVETKEGGRDENENRYIMKSAVPSSVDGSGLAHGASFKHFRSIYRVRQVWLRYAEAINRAGFPRLAFAVLRDGLDHQTLPTLTDSIKYINADSTKYHTVTYLDSTSVENTSRGVFYLGNDEMRRAQAEPEHSLFLPDFENKDNNEWLSNRGIHEQGCGASSVLDTIFSYKNVVAKRIEEEAKRTNSLTASVKRHIRNLRRYDVTVGDDTNTGTGDVEEDGEQKEPAPAEVNPLEVQAVETLIADECALETAYEGSRMFDLIRFARHMNNDASGASNFNATYGTTWLAWKIARRNENLKPYEDPTIYDGSLYTLLLDPSNWYIVSPKY